VTLIKTKSRNHSVDSHWETMEHIASCCSMLLSALSALSFGVVCGTLVRSSIIFVPCNSCSTSFPEIAEWACHFYILEVQGKTLHCYVGSLEQEVDLTSL
jgi:hypothetical protein